MWSRYDQTWSGSFPGYQHQVAKKPRRFLWLQWLGTTTGRSDWSGRCSRISGFCPRTDPQATTASATTAARQPDAGLAKGALSVLSGTVNHRVDSSGVFSWSFRDLQRSKTDRQSRHSGRVGIWLRGRGLADGRKKRGSGSPRSRVLRRCRADDVNLRLCNQPASPTID